MKTSIKYNKHALIGAVGPSVWAKLGPEDWFDNYVIVAANSRDFSSNFVVDLGLQQADLDEFTTEKIVKTSEFSHVAINQLPEHKFLVYRPIDPPDGVSPARLIANDTYYKKFEDKKIFREIFSELLPVPKYTVAEIDDFLSRRANDNYENYSKQFGGKFVIQDNKNGGGRGTFIVDSTDKMHDSMRILQEQHKGTHVILSQYIHGRELSIQAFVSSRYARKGPLQQQLVRNPDLLDVNGRGGMYFCGGKFVFDVDEHVERQIFNITDTVGNLMRKDGYVGIFGIDFLIDSDLNVFVLEINARTTGILPLLNEQKTAVPLHLLHILELAKEPYEIENHDQESFVKGKGPTSFVTLFNTTGHPAYLNESVTTGNYIFRDGNLAKINNSPRWHEHSDVMIQLFASKTFAAKTNLKLCNIFLRDDGFDDMGNLTKNTKELIDYVKGQAIN